MNEDKQANAIGKPQMVKMVPPEGCTSFSHDRVSYKMPKDGKPVEVTVELAAVMRSHGFTDYVAPPKAAK